MQEARFERMEQWREEDHSSQEKQPNTYTSARNKSGFGQSKEQAWGLYAEQNRNQMQKPTQRQRFSYQDDIDNEDGHPHRQFEMHHQNVSMEQLPVQNEFMIGEQLNQAQEVKRSVTPQTGFYMAPPKELQVNIQRVPRKLFARETTPQRTLKFQDQPQFIVSRTKSAGSKNYKNSKIGGKLTNSQKKSQGLAKTQTSMSGYIRHTASSLEKRKMPYHLIQSTTYQTKKGARGRNSKQVGQPSAKISRLAKIDKYQIFDKEAKSAGNPPRYCRLRNRSALNYTPAATNYYKFPPLQRSISELSRYSGLQHTPSIKSVDLSSLKKIRRNATSAELIKKSASNFGGKARKGRESELKRKTKKGMSKLSTKKRSPVSSKNSSQILLQRRVASIHSINRSELKSRKSNPKSVGNSVKKSTKSLKSRKSKSSKGLNSKKVKKVTKNSKIEQMLSQKPKMISRLSKPQKPSRIRQNQQETISPFEDLYRMNLEQQSSYPGEVNCYFPVTRSMDNQIQPTTFHNTQEVHHQSVHDAQNNLVNSQHPDLNTFETAPNEPRTRNQNPELSLVMLAEDNDAQNQARFENGHHTATFKGSRKQANHMQLNVGFKGGEFNNNNNDEAQQQIIHNQNQLLNNNNSQQQPIVNILTANQFAQNSNITDGTPQQHFRSAQQTAGYENSQTATFFGHNQNVQQTGDTMLYNGKMQQRSASSLTSQTQKAINQHLLKRSLSRQTSALEDSRSSFKAYEQNRIKGSEKEGTMTNHGASTTLVNPTSHLSSSLEIAGNRDSKNSWYPQSSVYQNHNQSHLVQKQAKLGQNSGGQALLSGDQNNNTMSYKSFMRSQAVQDSSINYNDYEVQLAPRAPLFTNSENLHSPTPATKKHRKNSKEKSQRKKQTSALRRNLSTYSHPLSKSSIASNSNSKKISRKGTQSKRLDTLIQQSLKNHNKNFVSRVGADRNHSKIIEGVNPLSTVFSQGRSHSCHELLPNQTSSVFSGRNHRIDFQGNLSRFDTARSKSAISRNSITATTAHIGGKFGEPLKTTESRQKLSDVNKELIQSMQIYFQGRLEQLKARILGVSQRSIGANRQNASHQKINSMRSVQMQLIRQEISLDQENEIENLKQKCLLQEKTYQKKYQCLLEKYEMKKAQSKKDIKEAQSKVSKVVQSQIIDLENQLDAYKRSGRTDKRSNSDFESLFQRNIYLENKIREMRAESDHETQSLLKDFKLKQKTKLKAKLEQAEAIFNERLSDELQLQERELNLVFKEQQRNVLDEHLNDCKENHIDLEEHEQIIRDIQSQAIEAYESDLMDQKEIVQEEADAKNKHLLQQLEEMEDRLVQEESETQQKCNFLEQEVKRLENELSTGRFKETEARVLFEQQIKEMENNFGYEKRLLTDQIEVLERDKLDDEKILIASRDELNQMQERLENTMQDLDATVQNLQMHESTLTQQNQTIFALQNDLKASEDACQKHEQALEVASKQISQRDSQIRKRVSESFRNELTKQKMNLQNLKSEMLLEVKVRQLECETDLKQLIGHTKRICATVELKEGQIRQLKRQNEINFVELKATKDSLALTSQKVAEQNKIITQLKEDQEFEVRNKLKKDQEKEIVIKNLQDELLNLKSELQRQQILLKGKESELAQANNDLKKWKKKHDKEMGAKERSMQELFYNKLDQKMQGLASQKDQQIANLTRDYKQELKNLKRQLQGKAKRDLELEKLLQYVETRGSRISAQNHNPNFMKPARRDTRAESAGQNRRQSQDCFNQNNVQYKNMAFNNQQTNLQTKSNINGTSGFSNALANALDLTDDIDRVVGQRGGNSSSLQFYSGSAEGQPRMRQNRADLRSSSLNQLSSSKLNSRIESEFQVQQQPQMQLQHLMRQDHPYYSNLNQSSGLQRSSLNMMNEVERQGTTKDVYQLNMSPKKKQQCSFGNQLENVDPISTSAQIRSKFVISGGQTKLDQNVAEQNDKVTDQNLAANRSFEARLLSVQNLQQ